jgi:glutathione S-transferase
MSKDLIFYTNPQSRGGIVHWMLEDVGAPYETKVLQYGPEMKSPDYLAVNPMGKVPAIKHGDVVVTEAAAICAYLADVFPEANLAPRVDARGAYYRWLFFAAACLEPAASNHAMGWNPETPQLQGRFGYGSYESVLDALAGWLKDRTYVASESFTAADVYVGSHLNFGMSFGTIEKRPEFVAYWDGLKERPGYKNTMAKIAAMMPTQS